MRIETLTWFKVQYLTEDRALELFAAHGLLMFRGGQRPPPLVVGVDHIDQSSV